MRTWLTALGDRIVLSGFHAQRAAFYRLLAHSMQSREQLRSFLSAELHISQQPATRDRSRAEALERMLRNLRHGHDHLLSQLLGPVMPAGDRLMLSALDYRTLAEKAEGYAVYVFVFLRASETESHTI